MSTRHKISQRDAFWIKVYELARQDRNIVVVSADMGAPALDNFRRDLPAQYVNVGIAEQHAVALASGLALSGKKVFVYAIAPFVSLRCLEQIRVQACLMKVPITLVGIGAGFSYEDSGPTHHLVEDITIMRSMPNLVINSISDSVMAAYFGEVSCTIKTANYVRLDRQISDDIYRAGQDFKSGLVVAREGTDNIILTTGAMVHSALHIAEKLSKKRRNIGVIDICTFPVNAPFMLEKTRRAKKLITLEEHFLYGGVGSSVAEVLSDHNVKIPLKRLGMSHDRGYCYQYGGREAIRRYYGLDLASVEKEIAAYLSA